MPSRLEDPPQKVGFMDEKWLYIEGGMGAAEAADGAVYLAIALRNAGNGIASGTAVSGIASRSARQPALVE